MHKPTILVIDADTNNYPELGSSYIFLHWQHHHGITLTDEVSDILGTFDNTYIDGVVGFNDVGSILASLVAQQRHLPGPTPRSIYTAQNKAVFLSLLTEKGIPVYPTAIISLTQKKISLPFSYPLFIRPIKGITSMYSYQISDIHIWNKTIKVLRHIQLDSQFYEEFFSLFDSPYSPLTDWFIVQPYSPAAQYTVDGFVYNHVVTILGVTQTHYNATKTSFERFDYPASISETVHKRLQKTLTDIMDATGYDGAGFNIEFFLDDNDTISIIEFNTRISNQFIPLLAQHYAVSPFQMMLELSTGAMPQLTKKIHQPKTASFALRIPHDATVIYRPSDSEIAQFIKEYDLLGLHLFAEVGKKLSDYRQDAYSFRYGLIDIAGTSQEEILSKFKRAIKHIPIVLDPPLTKS